MLNLKKYTLTYNFLKTKLNCHTEGEDIKLKYEINIVGKYIFLIV